MISWNAILEVHVKYKLVTSSESFNVSNGQFSGLINFMGYNKGNSIYKLKGNCEY